MAAIHLAQIRDLPENYGWNAALAFRAASMEYTHTWVPDEDMSHPQESLSMTCGLVLRVATW